MLLHDNGNHGFKITPDGIDGTIKESGEMFVLHRPGKRSGHIGQALVEYAPGKILAFYPNCCSSRVNGHNGFGWMEYKRSEDGGVTWSEAEKLDYSWQRFIDGQETIMCERAVCCDDGSIALFCFSSGSKADCWWPMNRVSCIRSEDQGNTWSEPVVFGENSNRIHDVVYHDGVIYVLSLTYILEQIKNRVDPHNPYTLYTTSYDLYVSYDNGKTFEHRSKLPFNLTPPDHGIYGALQFLDDGSLIAYREVYADEKYPRYVISKDQGKTWGEEKVTFMEKGMRNWNLIKFGGKYFTHSRCSIDARPNQNPEKGDGYLYVMYTSDDCINWDAGTFICDCTDEGFGGACFYSNSIVVHNEDGSEKNMLVQASVSYDKCSTDIKHWFVEKV